MESTNKNRDYLIEEIVLGRNIVKDYFSLEALNEITHDFNLSNIRNLSLEEIEIIRNMINEYINQEVDKLMNTKTLTPQDREKFIQVIKSKMGNSYKHISVGLLLITQRFFCKLKSEISIVL